MTGLHLSRYAIEAELGRGGMGVVYRAQDTKLNRTVALKVLPAAALASADDRARFIREAQSAAALNHPNVCHVYEVDEAVPARPDGGVVEGQTEPRLFIAMEYIEGQTLSNYLANGPVELREAVNIAGQVTEALREAHDKDIVHRDVKSANIMLTKGGVAKVLDFGLAKTNQSTMLTRMGSTLGTVAYMSPEQARGQEVDERSDLYSLGTVLYEMVAGRRPFLGDYEQAVIYGILNEAPEPLTALRTGVPMQLEWIVNKLLAKEAEYRYQSARGLLVDLKSLDLAGSGGIRRSIPPVTGVVATSDTPAIPTWVWGAIAGAFVLGLGAAWLLGSPPTAESPITRFAINLPALALPLTADWSPDGREIYYVAQDSTDSDTYIRVYHLSTGESRPLPGTEHVDYVHVSRDNRWLVFHDGRDQHYERMLLSGGEPSKIPGSDTPWPTGILTPDGDLVFPDADFDLRAVNPDGVSREIASNDTLQGPLFNQPVYTPEGGLMWSSWAITGRVNGTWMLAGKNGSPQEILPQYALQALGSNGYGLFLPSGTLGEPIAVAPIDTRTGRLLAAPVPFTRIENLTLSLSANGNLLYQEFGSQGLSGIIEPLYMLDASGGTRRVGVVPGVTNDFAAAWRRRAVVMESRESGQFRRDLYLFDMESQTATRLTRDGANANPDWSPDDAFVYFGRQSGDAPLFIARRRVDALGGIEVVYRSEEAPSGNPTISPDGRLMVFSRFSDSTAWDLYGLSLDGGEPFLISDALGAQSDAHFSPDGRYLVYRSGQEIGTIVVTSLEGEGEIELTDEGGFPVWSADGRYIYYKRSSQDIVRVEVTTDPVFAIVGAEERVHRSNTHSHFDLLADGSLLLSQPGSPEGEDLDPRTWVVLNFHKEMERLAPVPK